MDTELRDSTGRRWRQVDLTSLCDAALVAYRGAPGRAREMIATPKVRP
jgi:hypothetical protein